MLVVTRRPNSQTPGLGSAAIHPFDRSPILTSWTRQSPSWPLSLMTTRTMVLPFQCDTYHPLVHPIRTDTKNHSQRRSMSTSSANTPKATYANPNEKRRKKRPNENERRKRNTPRRPMLNSWRRSKARETMEGRRDSSGALKTLGARNTHTTAPKRLRVVHQGLVYSPSMSVPILKSE